MQKKQQPQNKQRDYILQQYKLRMSKTIPWGVHPTRSSDLPGGQLFNLVIACLGESYFVPERIKPQLDFCPLGPGFDIWQLYFLIQFLMLPENCGFLTISLSSPCISLLVAIKHPPAFSCFFLKRCQLKNKTLFSHQVKRTSLQADLYV